MKRVRAAACAGAALVVMWSAYAQASPEYSPEMQRHLGLGYVPRCALCHAGAPDGGDVDGGAVDTLFARSMIARGLHGGGEVASLDGALDAMKKDRVDSDGDGATDLDEIAYGGDPNVPNLPEGGAQSAPSYGCDAGGGGGSGTSGDAVTALLAIAVLYSCRARRLAIGPASFSSSPRRRHAS